MKNKEMTTALRLTKIEQTELYKKTVEINKTLVNNGYAPMQESEILHEFIAIGLKHLKATKEGKILIDTV
jgi:hypothetical protein